VAEVPTRVVLVGFMGAGKTAVGACLAERLGYQFEDMDGRIEKRTGRTITALFEEQGEEAFREEERREAAALAHLDRRVVAAGGGAFVQPRTRGLLQEGALTVWLRCDLETLLGRIPDDGARPLAGNRAIMRALLAEREPSYRQADVAVDTSGATPHEVVDRIVGLIERHGTGKTSLEQ
jgi:shikimate kinase